MHILELDVSIHDICVHWKLCSNIRPKGDSVKFLLIQSIQKPQKDQIEMIK